MTLEGTRVRHMEEAVFIHAQTFTWGTPCGVLERDAIQCLFLLSS